MTQQLACLFSEASDHRSRSTGKERDAETNNDYFMARYYNSDTGRFLSPDWSAKIEPVPYASLGDPQSLNLYSYVRNNPLASVDPDGHLENDLFPNISGMYDPAVAIWQKGALNRINQELAKAQQNAGSSGTSGGTPFTPVQSGGTTVTGTFDAFHGNRGSQGATIEATPSGCSDCQWIQGVKASDTNGGKQFIDGHEVMGSNPTYPIGGNGHNGLDDQAYRGHAVSWTAVSVFGHTNEKNHTFTAVGAITWGFSISSRGHLRSEPLQRHLEVRCPELFDKYLIPPTTRHGASNETHFIFYWNIVVNGLCTFFVVRKGFLGARSQCIVTIEY